MSEQFIEIENTYLTNQPLIWGGRGKGRQRIPDPDVEPTEAWLFCYRCTQTKRGIRRQRFLKTLVGENRDALEEQIAAEVSKGVLIKDQESPRDYIKYRGLADIQEIA